MSGQEMVRMEASIDGSEVNFDPPESSLLGRLRKDGQGRCAISQKIVLNGHSMIEVGSI